MDLMSLFRPQAPAAPGAAAPAQQPMFSGLLPPAGTDERRAFARALLTASAQLANQPGNFLQGMTAGLAQGGLQYRDELDQIDDERKRDEERTLDRLDRRQRDNYDRQKDERSYQLDKQRADAYVEASKADATSKLRQKQQAVKAGKVDEPSKDDVALAREDAREAVAELDPAATPEERKAIYDSTFQERLSFYFRSRQSLRSTAAPAAAEPQGLNTDGGIVEAPPVGTIEDGYRFTGGDPRDENSWEPAE